MSSFKFKHGAKENDYIEGWLQIWKISLGDVYSYKKDAEYAAMLNEINHPLQFFLWK